MAKLVIFGCGRGADVAARYFCSDSAHQVCGFTVEKPYLSSDSFRGLPLVDFEIVQEHFPPRDFQMFIPLGFRKMNALRAQIYQGVKRKGYSCASYISSKVVTHDTLRVGENCFILENNTINHDVRIGNNVVIWSACQIGDQSIIGDHVWISSHAALAGEVVIGEYSFLGVNCTISNYVKIARKNYIGAAAFISQDTVENGVYVVEGTKCFKIESEQFLKFMESMQKQMHE
jgi:sugar O-acyltransferase (sialic acid O-acetyltransferase NeuD family)